MKRVIGLDSNEPYHNGACHQFFFVDIGGWDLGVCEGCNIGVGGSFEDGKSGVDSQVGHQGSTDTVFDKLAMVQADGSVWHGQQIHSYTQTLTS